MTNDRLQMTNYTLQPFRRSSPYSQAGFLAGRSIWRDAASTKDAELREKAGLDAANRLAELANITRACGKPFNPQLEGEELTQAFPEFWYEKWQR